MRLTAFILLALIFSSCESGNFDADKRQIMAKDAIHYKLGRVRDYNVLSFREDTLNAWTDTMIKKPIVYSLRVSYTDSTGKADARDASVVFTPDGKSILQTRLEGMTP